MRHKFQTRRDVLTATCMMIATMAIGLQPLLFNPGSGCTCNAKNLLVASEYVGTSCSELAEQQTQVSCCSLKLASANKCCCNPDATVCECGSGCGCSEGDDTHSTLPAIPTKEATEVVCPVFMYSAPMVGLPRETENNRADFPKSAAEHAARSSQETCVLLSRFTC